MSWASIGPPIIATRRLRLKYQEILNELQDSRHIG